MKFTYSRWVSAIVLAAILVATLALVGQGIPLISPVSEAGGAAASLSGLVFYGAAGGIFAYAFVEFVKRQSSLRWRFNKRSARRFYRSVGDVASSRARQQGEYDPRFQAPPRSLYYGAALRQLSVQISQDLRSRVPSVISREVDSLARFLNLRMILGEGQVEQSYFPADFEDELRDDDEWSAEAIVERWRRAVWRPEDPIRTESSNYEQFGLWLEEYIERRVDVFQMAATENWRWLLRATSAGVSAISLGFGAYVLSGWAAVPASALLGLIVGGPTSWTLRDIVRIVERKATYG